MAYYLSDIRATSHTQSGKWCLGKRECYYYHSKLQQITRICNSLNYQCSHCNSNTSNTNMEFFRGFCVLHNKFLQHIFKVVEVINLHLFIEKKKAIQMCFQSEFSCTICISIRESVVLLDSKCRCWISILLKSGIYAHSDDFKR